ncbi:cysteine sulfinic acid decarboxylase-like [Plakobranchus ocellatus]|uniref:Cysteine sulfinic acid decarboxylase-like n=1 Tax=Plakobranchus ocellatus TaxID=259542 RepID=A0AAV3ZGN4_9GAST|nr:cysteine sulfinic acid decarboxylase-like [Plakobranchus ocellatus]
MASLTKGMSFNNPEVIKFLDEAYRLIKEEALQKGTSRDYPVLEFMHPHELESTLDLEITAEPASHEQILDAMKNIIRYSIKTGHPRFHNQLFGSLDPYSQAGAWLASSLNANIHTYEVCPVFIIMEKYFFQKILNIVGFEHGDGVFCPGGSASNFFSIHLARFKKFPEAKKNGLFGSAPFRCYASEDGHYSMQKAAIFLGLGMNNLVGVKTDGRGHIIPSELERCIKADLDKGYTPLMVTATSGTTVLGSYDDLPAISKVCKKYDLWLHADACWGGGALLSKKHRHLLKGSHLCNSMSWNFHKMTGVPVQTSVFLINDPSKKLLEEANSAKAEYLFQPDKHYDTSYDVGDKTVQCGRAVDITKVWLQWRALGDEGMEARIDRGFENARYLTQKLRSTEGFRLVLPEFECTNVSFWYIPHRLRGQVEDNKWWQELHKIAPKLKERMVKAGNLMIQYQPLSTKGFVNFFRIIILNPLCGPRDMDFVIEEFERLGKDL